MSELVYEEIKITGMTCIHCQNRIEKTFRKTEGVKKAVCKYTDGILKITYDPEVISRKDIERIVRKTGYNIQENEDRKKQILQKIIPAGAIVILFILLEKTHVLNLLVPSQLADSGMSYGMLFVTGLLTSVHCLAMCGGINLSQSLPSKEASPSGRLQAFQPTLLYNAGRILSYTLVGFILGGIGMILGQATNIIASGALQGTVKLIAGILMILMGINMLNLVPPLRKLTIRMPSGLRRKLSGKNKSRGAFAVGLLNGLMPCGPLQSMQLIALATGNPFTGALSMFMFSLGTVPLMLGFGSVITALGQKFRQYVTTAGAVLVTVMGLAMLTQGLTLSGAVNLLPDTQTASVEESEEDSEEEDEVNADVQYVESTLASGYYPSIEVEAGIPVVWTITVPDGTLNGCNQTMIISAYDLRISLTEGENVIEFTPEETGSFVYSCWMGMISGRITVS